MKSFAALGARVVVFGLIPMCTGAGMVLADRPARQFVPPAEDVVMVRSLVRELSDGNQVVVSRKYRLRFAPLAEGYEVDGVLLGVTVDAPPLLAGLADLERNRVDVGLFPIALGNDGLLSGQTPPAPAQSSEVRRQAGALLGARIARTEAVGGPGIGNRLLDRLAQNGATSPWPADLFRSRPGERRFGREISLADGRTGAVEVVLRVDTLLPCGLPRRFERTVITQLPGSRTISHEIFTFAAPARQP